VLSDPSRPRRSPSTVLARENFIDECFTSHRFTLDQIARLLPIKAY
jgi:hypothetical protein